MVGTVEHQGQQYAALHYLLEFWGADHLCDPIKLEEALISAAVAAKATVLHCYLHTFDLEGVEGEGGVTGVALLAESHISIHTWPEFDYAAIDIFMCGGSQPQKAVEVLEAALRPQKMEINKVPRGKVSLSK